MAKANSRRRYKAASRVVRDVVFVVPASDEATTTARLLDTIGPPLQKQVESQKKPWPGKWEAIQPEIDPSLR